MLCHLSEIEKDSGQAQRGAISAIDQYGWDKCFEFPHEVCQLTCDEFGMDWMLDQIQRLDNRAPNDNTKGHLARAVCAAPIDLVQGRLERINTVLNRNAHRLAFVRSHETWDQLNERLRIWTQSPQLCFEQLKDHCSNLDEDTLFSEAGVPRMEMLVSRIATAEPECFLSDMLGTLGQETSSDFQPDDWFLGAMIILAGHTRCEAAAPLLLTHFEADWDWWNEEIANSLSRIGGPKVLDYICKAYPSAVDHARLYLSGTLQSFNFGAAAKAISSLLHRELDDDYRVNLAESLAAQFEPKSADEACLVYKENPEDPERETLASFLYAHSQIRNPGFEQADIDCWRHRLDESYRRMPRIREYTKEAFSAMNNADDIRSRVDSAASNSITPDTASSVRNLPKVGRNDPCPCGSGKKYKKCCLQN